ncbi:MAG: HlyD family secretion protein [Acidobacteriota bacterium]
MDKELQALRIDRSKKRPEASGSKTWLVVLLSLFAGAVLTSLFFRFLLVQGSESAQDAAVLAAASDQSAAPAGATAEADSVAPLQPVLIVSGYVVPHHRIEVGSKILGKVAWVGVEKSDRVKKGQLLVKLDDREFRTQLEQAEAALASSRARLAELEAGSRPEEVQRGEAELRRSRADLENAELEYRRLESLLKTGVLSKQEVDNARARRDMAAAAVGVAERNHRLLVLGPRREQIDLARAEVDRNQAALQYWQTQLAETEIRAPITGTILERRAEVGEMVSTSFAGGAVVVALADLNDLQVELDVSQADFHNISPENGCQMTPVAYTERRYRCEIVEIAPEANRQRATIQVKVQVLDPDEYLRPEMDAQVSFLSPPAPKERGELN